MRKVLECNQEQIWRWGESGKLNINLIIVKICNTVLSSYKPSSRQGAMKNSIYQKRKNIYFKCKLKNNVK